MPISIKRLAEIESINEEDIDTSDIPEVDESFFRAAQLVMATSTNKKAVSMRIDEDVLEWFKSEGKGHLSRMNAVLRAYMITHHSSQTDEVRK